MNILRLIACSALLLVGAAPELAWPANDPPQAICRKIVDRYQKIVATNPQAPFAKGAYADGPLDVLVAAKSSGVALADIGALEGSQKDLSQALADWGRKQKPPVVFSKEVVADLSEIATPDGALSISRLPDTDLYRLYAIGGTAGCYASKYFVVKDGRAQLAQGPQDWSEENGAGCGVSRSFGKIDSDPVAFEDDYAPGGAELGATLAVHGWSGEKFAPLCAIRFEFQPRFMAHGSYNAWDESCDRADCDALRNAALALVETATPNPAAARERLIAKLTATQRRDFAAMQENSNPVASPAGQAEATDQSPLVLPLVYKGTLYRASLGHFTIGWRVFTDWSVAIEQQDKGGLAKIATFAIGMTKGKPTKAQVK
jgi:hypothetical protein